MFCRLVWLSAAHGVLKDIIQQRWALDQILFSCYVCKG